jgi:hypothetical protein
MRSIKWAVAVVLTSGLLGCGGSQPSIYRVAIERLTVANVPAACYRSGQAPTTIPDKTTNMVDEEQWVYWDGVEDQAYLDIGNINYGLGQAQRVNIAGDSIQGGKDGDSYVFKAERVETDSATEIYTTSATYTIDKLGETLEGTLALRSACVGTDCAGTPTCEVSLKFVGRKIKTDQLSIYGTTGGN